MSWQPPPFSNDESLNIHVFNILHGDCIIIELPRDPDFRNYILLDTHGYFTYWMKNYIKDFIGFGIQEEPKQFICGIISHGHRDHCGEFLEFAKTYLDGKLIHLAHNHTKNVAQYRTLQKNLAKENITINYPDKGDTIHTHTYQIMLPKGLLNIPLSIKVAGPTNGTIIDQLKNKTNHGVNNLSLIIEITYGNSYIVLSGDAETESWGNIMNTLPNHF